MAKVRMTSRPCLGAHTRLQWDSVREKQMLLAPERVLVLNEMAAAILARCDGVHNVSEIAADLAGQYHQAVDEDVRTLLNRLADKGLIQVDDHD